MSAVQCVLCPVPQSCHREQLLLSGRRFQSISLAGSVEAQTVEVVWFLPSARVVAER